MKQILDQDVDVVSRLQRNDLQLIFLGLQFLLGLPADGFAQFLYVTLNTSREILQSQSEFLELFSVLHQEFGSLLAQLVKGVHQTLHVTEL